MNKLQGNSCGRWLPGVAIAVVAGATGVAQPAHAETAEDIVVPPTVLPAIARQSGEAMFLQETPYRRAVLYIEQNQGTRLAVLDVTDPGHIGDRGSLLLDADGPFDFVSNIGAQEELLQFRSGQGTAVLDLSKVTVPILAPIPRLTFPDAALRLGDDALAMTSPATAAPQATRDNQVVAPLPATTLPQVFDVKDVRQNASKSDMGTTFLLTDEGQFVIRRPRGEMNKATWELDHGH